MRLAQLENENAELRAENKESKVQEVKYESGERESAVEEGGERENSESESDESKSSGSEAYLREKVGWESEDGRFRTFKITPSEYFDGIDIDDIPSTVSSAEQDVVRTLMSSRLQICHRNCERAAAGISTDAVVEKCGCVN